MAEEMLARVSARSAVALHRRLDQAGNGPSDVTVERVVAERALLRAPPGPQYPGAPFRSTPHTIAADPPYQARTPFVAGVQLTPEVVTAALRRSELGYMSRYVDLLSECREKVPHLQAVLSIRELSVSGCAWKISPKNHGDKARKNKTATKVSDYVHERIDEIPQLGEAIQHLVGADYYGRTGLETEWKRDARGVGVERFHAIHPKRLSYAANWRVHLWDEYGNEYDPRLGQFPGVDVQAEFPEKFVVHAPITMGPEIPTRQGLGRVLVWYALFWMWSQRDWMRFAELFGQPWRVAFYDKAFADQDDIELVKRALQQMSVATTAVLPSTTKFDLKMPNARAPVHESLRNALNSEISKVVLGQTLTTDATPGGGGAYALGKIHNDVRLDVKRNCGRAVSETLTRYVVGPMVRKQFGDKVAREFTPRFELITEEEEDINQELERVCKLADRGVPFNVDDARDYFTTLPKPENPKVENLMQPVATVGKVAMTLPVDPADPPGLPEPTPPPAFGPDGKPVAALPPGPGGKGKKPGPAAPPAPSAEPDDGDDPDD